MSLKGNMQFRGSHSWLLSIIGVGLAALIVVATWATVEAVAAITTRNDHMILHLKVTRIQNGDDGTKTSQEVWLDTETRDGQIVQRAVDGTLLRVQAVTDGVYTLYLPDAKHAVIRYDVDPNSSLALRVWDEVFGAQAAAERGVVAKVGQGDVDGIATERIRGQLDDGTLTVDLDPETGLVLREEFAREGKPIAVTEVEYILIEHLSRDSVSDAVFEVEIPADVEREEYFNGEPSNLAADVAYAVYVPKNPGANVFAFRHVSLAIERAASDSTYLIYREAGREIQVISSYLFDRSAVAPQHGPFATVSSDTIKVGEVVWQIQDHLASAGFQASADLDGAHVTIIAPDRASFELAAGSLERAD